MTPLAVLAAVTALAAAACILPGRQRPAERPPATRQQLPGIYPPTLAAWRSWPIEAGPRICAGRAVTVQRPTCLRVADGQRSACTSADHGMDL